MSRLEQRLMNVLSMAARARRIVSGSFVVEEAVKKGTGRLVLVAEDAQAPTKIKFQELAEKNHIPFAECLTKEELGRCLGKDYRACAALLDQGFSQKMQQLLEQKEE